MAVIVCPICSTRYRVAEAQLSQASRLKCKKCKTVFPVSDNIKSDSSSQKEEVTPLNPPTPEPEDTSASHTLEFPGLQDEPPQTLQEAAEVPQDDSSGLGDFSLDFNIPSEATVEAPSLDFSFSTETPEVPENGGEDVILEDHIVDSLHTGQGEIEVGLGNLTLNSDDNGETTLSMDGGSSLDFSFSAVVPESGPDDEQEEQEHGDQLLEEEGDDGGAIQDLSLNLDIGTPQADDIPDDATMTMAGSPESAALDISLDGLETEQEADFAVESESDEYAEEDDYSEEEPLNTCCVDSLAMGYTTCELCGRNLQGLEDNEFVQQRRQQLRAELPEGEVQIGFSEEGDAEAQHKAMAPPEEDFSDVEQALDALDRNK